MASPGPGVGPFLENALGWLLGRDMLAAMRD